MNSLVKQLTARMNNPELNKNFTQAVNTSKEVTNDDKINYALVHKAFQKFKKRH